MNNCFGHLFGDNCCWIIIIALIILLLFGGKKIPELMRGLGKGVSQFKKGMNDIEQEINAEPKKNEEIQN